MAAKKRSGKKRKRGARGMSPLDPIEFLKRNYPTISRPPTTEWDNDLQKWVRLKPGTMKRFGITEKQLKKAEREVAAEKKKWG
jgi:hypothetical protein